MPLMNDFSKWAVEMIIVYSLCSILFFWLIGFLFSHFVKVQNIGRPTIHVLTGFCIFLSVLMSVGTVVPISMGSRLLFLLVIILAFIYLNDIKRFITGFSRYDIFVIISWMIVVSVIGLPQLINGELYISIIENNDFAYYISSIDWLRNHSILENVDYSQEKPFYSLASFMLNETRIGMDVAAAFLCNIFSLEAYEIFPVMIVVSSIMVMIAIHNSLIVFGVNKYVCILFSVLAVLNGNIILMASRQYPSQILGIALLISTFLCLHKFFYSSSRHWLIYSGIFISGLFAVYCEFSIYLVGFGLLYVVPALWTSLVSVRDLIKLILIAIFSNVFAFYRALEFNLNIFIRVLSGGSQAIDPFQGALLQGVDLFGSIMGFSTRYSHSLAIGIFSLIFICLAVLFFLYSLVKYRYQEEIFFGALLVLFIVLEFYFRTSGGAYQEFKHISTVAIVLFLFWGYLLSSFCKLIQMKTLGIFCTLFLFSLFVLSGLFKPLKDYVCSNNVVDSAVVELKNAVDLLVDRGGGSQIG